MEDSLDKSRPSLIFFQLIASLFFQQIFFWVDINRYQKIKCIQFIQKILQQMILEPNRDQYTKLQIKLTQSCFVSGKKLAGVIVIDANIDRPYTSLVLKLECIQELLNKQKDLLIFFGGQKSRSRRQNSVFQRETEASDEINFREKEKLKRAINYEQKIIIKKFDEFLPKGQHFLPFSLILPKGLPGSLLIENQNIYAKIQYQITATLLDDKNPYIRKSASKVVQIAQQNQKIQYVERTLHPQNCYCFNFRSNDDSIRVYYQINNSFVVPGSQFNITGKIDTRDTSQDIQGIQLVLKRKILVREKVRPMTLESKEWVLWNGFRKIRKGQSYPLHITVNVPGDIEYPSTKGNFIGIFYEMVMRIDSKNLHGINQIGAKLCLQVLNQLNNEGKSDNSVGSIKSEKQIKLNPYPVGKQINSGIKKNKDEQF